jgi:hypothetical protein
MRRGWATILFWESNEYYTTECVFVALDTSMQCACTVLSWPARLYGIFPHFLINGTIFEKQVTEHKMCVLSFSTNFVWNIPHS